MSKQTPIDARSNSEVIQQALAALAELEGCLDALRCRGEIPRMRWLGVLESMHAGLHRYQKQVLTFGDGRECGMKRGNTSFEELRRAEYIRPEILDFLSRQPGRRSNSLIIRNWLDYLAMPLPHDEVCHELHRLERLGKVVLEPTGHHRSLGVCLAVELGQP